MIISIVTATLNTPTTQTSIPLAQTSIRTVLGQIRLVRHKQSTEVTHRGSFVAIKSTVEATTRSRTRLQFGSKSLTHINRQTAFQFIPGAHGFHLSGNATLLLIPPKQNHAAVRAPDTAAKVRNSTIIIHRVRRHGLAMIVTLAGGPTKPVAIAATTYTGNTSGTKRGYITRRPLCTKRVTVVRSGRIRVLRFSLPTFRHADDLLRKLRLSGPSTGSSLKPTLSRIETRALRTLTKTSLFPKTAILGPGLMKVRSSRRDLAGRP